MIIFIIDQSILIDKLAYLFKKDIVTAFKVH